MRYIIIIFIFISSICDAQQFRPIGDNAGRSHPYLEQYSKKKPCGRGPFPPCAVPLDEHEYVLIIAGLILIFKVLRVKKSIL